MLWLAGASDCTSNLVHSAYVWARECTHAMLKADLVLHLCLRFRLLDVLRSCLQVHSMATKPFRVHTRSCLAAAL